jgi:hypothetical protein
MFYEMSEVGQIQNRKKTGRKATQKKAAEKQLKKFLVGKNKAEEL